MHMESVQLPDEWGCKGFRMVGVTWYRVSGNVGSRVSSIRVPVLTSLRPTNVCMRSTYLATLSALCRWFGLRLGKLYRLLSSAIRPGGGIAARGCELGSAYGAEHVGSLAHVRLQKQWTQQLIGATLASHSLMSASNHAKVLPPQKGCS